MPVQFIFFMANNYYFGVKGLQQDHAKAIELFTRQRNSVVVRHMVTLVCSIVKGEI
jgi:hypothetical protein